MMKLVVLSCVMAAATASVIAPIAPLAYNTYTAPILTPSNYRGPLSLAPGQPANIIAADGRPLDTLDVNLDRAAHLTAKAVESGRVHLLKKRSVALVAPISPIISPAPLITHTGPLAYAASGLAAPGIAAPITYTAPLVHW